MFLVKRGLLGALFLILVTLVNYVPVAWGSIFGEENATLVQILSQTFEMTDELQDINDGLQVTAEVMTDVRDTYNAVNAGIDELQNYSFDRFLDEFKQDLYHQYPGFAELEGGSEKLRFWEDTHAHSPFTAYEAITAVAGDLSPYLRDDVSAGRVNIDQELILKGEAAGAFALASGAEDATRAFDEDTEALAEFAAAASPGQAEQITAKGVVLIAAQNSHIIRLLARGVRLDGVDSALEYGRRMRARNQAYEQDEQTNAFLDAALTPSPLMDFDLE